MATTILGRQTIGDFKAATGPLQAPIRVYLALLRLMDWGEITQRAAYKPCIDMALELWEAGAQNEAAEDALERAKEFAAKIAKKYPGKGSEAEIAELLMAAYACGQKHAKD